MSFLEEAWKEREEESYKWIFGDIGYGIYTLTVDIFKRMNIDSVDPRWLTYGVFKYPPNEKRETWAYVTSGMSNPWEDEVPEEYSGLGMEFVMETELEADWAIEVLLTLTAYNLILVNGLINDSQSIIDYGHRVPLNLSESIKIMMFTYPQNFPESFCIQSGRIDLIQVVGITASELEYAKDTSSDDLRTKIISSNGDLLTRKVRESVA